MDEQIVVYPFNPILLSSEGERATDRVNNLNESQKHVEEKSKLRREWTKWKREG